MITCEFCKNKFNSNSALKHHQNTARYCLKIRGITKSCFKCEACDKTFSNKYNLSIHKVNCSKLHQNNKLRIKNQIIQDKNNFIDELKNQICELRKSLTECAMEAIKNQKDENKVKKLRIKYLENKYLKKQKRVEYKGNNFIYILTTPGLKKERRYILGKATNLTNRLSTYNKTDEHEVVFYSHCPCKDTMGVIEGLVFTKLNKYRERSNRERFILPHDQDIDIFVNCIKRCVDFVK
jgi:hypothetical protein